ncbi:MAG: N-acetyl-gamma-glutamyl-phosphate reductase [Litorimonas sp.]
MKHVAVLGASGYTGAEAVRLILGHPKLKLAAMTAHSRAGETYSDVFRNFAGQDLPPLTTLDEVDWEGIDVVFACLPHGASQETIAKIYDRVETVIDLSADFRLSDADLYAKTYGRPHEFEGLLQGRVYGLTEFARDLLPGSKLVACPGCYPTCSMLALLPGLASGIIDSENVIIDAKSGVTGAGRKASLAFAYSETTDGAQAYAIGTHRHAPEMDQAIADFASCSVNVRFTPHLLPMNRGMIATCHVKLKEGASISDLRKHYEDTYQSEAFVHVLEEGQVPQTRHVRGSNHCQIGIFADRTPNSAVIVSVIDNLTKGSSGQAIQNYNVVRGWDETLGLQQVGVFP